MTGYYTDHLSGERLRRCYEIATPPVREYLEGEIQHLLARLPATGPVLELGCGYGRVALRLAGPDRPVTGIDNATGSLALARRLAGAGSRCEFLEMDACRLQFPADHFAAVVCIQNGICAFRADPEILLREALRVARPGGRLFFSTYLDRFWPHRLAWFEDQAAAGLLGPVDLAASGNGVIVCTDGFCSGRFTPEQFRELCTRLAVDFTLAEAANSSLFCEIVKPD